jgi:hypothetical protein
VLRKGLFKFALGQSRCWKLERKCERDERSFLAREIRRNGPRLKSHLSNIVAIGKKPLHRFPESFEERVFRVKAKKFFGPADV